MSRNTWAWVYGDECKFLWDHFNIEPKNNNDRIKIKLIDFERERSLEENLLTQLKREENDES